MRILLMLLLAASRAHAAFDETGYSPRALSMGGAFTAVYDDPASVAFNPASIGQLRNIDFETAYLRQFHIPAGEVDQDQINTTVGVPLNQDLIKGGMGISWSYVSQRNFAIDRTAALTYGSRGFHEFEDGTLELGTTLKILSRNFAESGGSTKSTMDLGTLWRFKEKYAVGISVLNFNGPSFRGQGLSDRVPATLKIGVSEVIRGFTFAADVSKRESTGFHSGSTNIGAGLENWWASARWGSLALRSGVNFGDQDKEWGLGFGWRIFSGQFDYAMSIPLMGSTRVSHAVSARYRFGASNPEGEYERLLQEELRYRKDLSNSLEMAEVKQWKMAEDLNALRDEIESLNSKLNDKTASEKDTRQKLKELQERHRQAAEAHEKMLEDGRRLKAKTKEAFFREDWAAYQKLKAGGAPDGVLQDSVKRILRQYKEAGVDLSQANQELRRLLQGK